MIVLHGIEEQRFRRELRVRVRRVVRDFGGELRGSERAVYLWRIVAEEPLLLRAVGERVGLSRERVRQVETRLLARLGEWMRAAFTVAELAELGAAAPAPAPARPLAAVPDPGIPAPSAEVVRAVRQELRLTAERMALALGASQTFFSRWERGEARMPARYRAAFWTLAQREPHPSGAGASPQGAPRSIPVDQPLRLAARRPGAQRPRSPLSGGGSADRP